VLQLGSDGARHYRHTIVVADGCRVGTPCDLSRGVVTDDDAGTVTFFLTAPDGDFLHKLALPYASAVPASIGPRGATLGRPIPATGPYMIAAGSDPGRQLVLTHNPLFREWSHAAQPAGFPDRLVFEISDYDDELASAAVDAVLRGDADVAISPRRGRAHELETRYAPLIRRHPTTFVAAIFLNTHERPFDDLRVRRALNLALDRRRMIRSIGFGQFEPACQLLPRNSPGYVPYCPYTIGPKDGGWHGPDLAQARRLVQVSGTAGMGVTFWAPLRRAAIGNVVVATLRQLGYDAQLQTMSKDEYDRAVYRRPRTDMQIGDMNAYQPDYPAGASLLDPGYTCGQGGDQYGYRDRAICADIRRARALAGQGREREATDLDEDRPRPRRPCAVRGLRLVLRDRGRLPSRRQLPLQSAVRPDARSGMGALDRRARLVYGVYRAAGLADRPGLRDATPALLLGQLLGGGLVFVGREVVGLDVRRLRRGRRQLLRLLGAFGLFHVSTLTFVHGRSFRFAVLALTGRTTARRSSSPDRDRARTRS
jgi:peptide/nickel transport system substrate-binding protein